jgi:hypothetical protein
MSLAYYRDVCYTAFLGCKAANPLISWPAIGVGHERTASCRLGRIRTKENTVQKHIRFAIYTLTSGTFDEVAGLTKDGLLPLFSKEPGFIEYGVANLGDRKVASVTIWETREQAEKSVNVASTWIRENVSNRIQLVTSYAGELAFMHGTPVLA